METGTDKFTGLIAGCLELCEAFVSLILQLSNNCKVDFYVLLTGGETEAQKFNGLLR